MQDPRVTYVNVKIPQLFVDIIDGNLREGKSLRIAGFSGRAHFVQEAVAEKLIQLGLVSQGNRRKIEEIMKSRLAGRKLKRQTS